MSKKRPQPLEQQVLAFIRGNRLLKAGQKLVVAVSGGPDSVCLLSVLLELQPELNISLHIAHLDHQLRGADSDADAAYVSELARRFSLPATIERRDVKKYQLERRLSLEEAAREVRYTFLAQVAGSTGANCVAAGHTLDDNIETILMHLVRGTGTRGLRGLQPVTTWRLGDDRLTIIRPLLAVRREQTVDYCASHHLSPRTDASNLSLSPLRNRIRLQLLPLLKGYNPQVADALLRTARTASDELAYLDEEVGRVWTEIVQESKGSIILHKDKFKLLPPALQRHLLRSGVIEKLLGNLKDIETRHIEEIVTALSKPAGKRIVLPEGLVFSIEYDRYLIGYDPTSSSPFPPLDVEVALNIPGETFISGWRIEAKVISREQMPELRTSRVETEKPEGAPIPSENITLTAHFDFERVGDRLTVRPRRRADRFQPLGMSETKSLADFMVDSKIPHAWRDRVPITATPEQIIWVVGYRIDERVKVTEKTEKVLQLRFELIN